MSNIFFSVLVDSMSVLTWIAACGYVLAVTLLAGYGVHSLWLLRRFLGARHQAAEVAQREATALEDHDLPRVLVQIPVFNERDVVTRIVRAVGEFSWPRDRLIVQLLDDSTDDSVAIGHRAIAELQSKGMEAVSLHRVDRVGYKAGALDAGMAACDAPFIAIFDADFVPAPDFLQRAIPALLTDPGLALVQGRWEHLNRDYNLLTKAQALGIDGHFAIEQGARAWSGLAMNFNGTCGLWRREAIIDSGGWEHDTLTEDMDLSYRAQLRGWRCTYRLGLAVPGEIPATLAAWRQQQFRWAKGSIQTACKLLPRVLRSNWNFEQKVGAVAHMTHYLVHPLILLSLLCAPFALNVAHDLPMWVLMFGLVGFAVGAGAPPLLYAVSQYILHGRSGMRRLLTLPALAAIGTGIAVSNTIAVWEAITGQQSPFVRTPKQGSGSGSYKASGASGMPELLCALWASFGLCLGIDGRHGWIAPLLGIYVSGFLYVAWFSVAERARAYADGKGSPLPYLIPAGVGAIAAMGLLAWRITQGTSGPYDQALAAAVLAIACVVGLLAVRNKTGNVGTLSWIVVVAVLLRVCAFFMPAGEAVPRTLMEGRMFEIAANPYTTTPVQAAANPGLMGRIDPAWVDEMPFRHVTSPNPPLMLWLQAAIASVSSGPLFIKICALFGDIAALGLLTAFIIQRRCAPSIIVAAAWHPILVLCAGGAGHLDALASLPLLMAIIVAARRPFASLLWATVGGLIRPFTGVAVLPVLWNRSWKWWLVPPALALLAWLPFAQAGTQAWQGMTYQATILSSHGPLQPIAHAIAGLWWTGTGLHVATLAILGLTFLAGILAWAWRRSDADSGAEPSTTPDVALTSAWFLTWLFVCSPALNPWFLTPLVLLVPMMGSVSIAVWTAVALPLWLLHPTIGDTMLREDLPLLSAASNVPLLGLVLHLWRSTNSAKSDGDTVNDDPALAT